MGLKKANQTSFKKGIIPWNKGTHHSSSTKEKLSKAWDYKKHFTQATKEKLSRAGRGRKVSAATRKKISASLKGHPITEKVRETFRKHGKMRIGEKNPSWKGVRTVWKGGFPTMWSYGRRVSEHVGVMEQDIGRKLLRDGKYRGEVVHHKNGDHFDNRLENLQLFSSNSEHIKEEQRLNSFAKKILFADLIPELQEQLLKAYNDFQQVK